jgi:hypothetical protein
MDRARTGLLLVAVFAGALVAGVEAKGTTVRLTVAGPGLPYPVELASSDAVKANVFGGAFVGKAVAQPDRALPRYTVSFFVETPRNPVRMMYVVGFVRNPQTGETSVYIPGPADEWYRLNIRTILRGQEGEWHRADASWGSAVARVLP